MRFFPGAVQLNCLACLALLLTLLAPLPQAWAQRPTYNDQLQLWAGQDAAVTQQLTNGELTTEQASDARAAVAERIKDARALTAKLKSVAEPIEAQLQALGPPPQEGLVESEDVAAKRTSLQGEISRLQSLSRQADAAVARAMALDSQLARYRLRIATDRLQDRGPSVLSLETWRRAASDLSKSLSAKSEIQVPTLQPEISLIGILKIFSALGLAAAVVVWGHSAAKRSLVRSENAATPQLRRIGYAAAAIVSRLCAVFIALVAIYIVVEDSGSWTAAHLEALKRVLWIGTFASFIYGIVAVMLGRGRAAFNLPPIEKRKVKLTVRALTWLAAAMAADAAILGYGTLQSTETETLIVANTVSITFIAAIFLRLLVCYLNLRESEVGTRQAVTDDGTAAPRDEDQGGFGNLGQRINRYAVYLFATVAVIAPLLAIAGYFALSRYLMIRVVFTASLLTSLVAIYQLADAALDVYGQRLREMARSNIGSLGIFNLLIASSLVFVGGVLLALIWGASFSDIAFALERFGDGFNVGTITISPTAILRFLVILALIYVATRVIQGFLRGAVLAKTQLDTSARDAIVAGTGYAGILLGGVLAASFSGLDLSNLAILAGALSVGIGFGLQTVVSNFVSGIILMVERPIRIGDWIAVGDQQGYVKRISVRSTEIETFDRASYIMPNADLIATPVLNWTLKSPIGRVTCPVGVAYGSDPKQVLSILSEIASAHPLVLRRPPPTALFIAFGDSSLNFEIRAFLRDINYLMSVRSDLNLAIFERFAQEGIEIPFPQRDLHIRSLSELPSTKSDEDPRLAQILGPQPTQPQPIEPEPTKAQAAKSKPDKPSPAKPKSAKSESPEPRKAPRRQRGRRLRAHRLQAQRLTG